MTHRSVIVFVVALASYAVGRMGASPGVIVLFGLVVASTLSAYLFGRGNDRFALVYASVMGLAAATIAGLVSRAF